MATIHIKLPSAQRITDCLLALVMTLVMLSLLGQFAKYVLGHTMLKGFVPTFYVDNEPSAPTWYSSAALGLVGVLLALIAAARMQTSDVYRWHWATLSLLFFGLSMDEIAMIHELPIDPLREMFGWGGVLYFGWVVPGAVLVALVAIIYRKFLLSLPRRTQRLFVLAGLIFVGGAIGVEMVSGVQADQHGEENLAYALIVTLEELMEMLGVIVLIRALLEYIEEHIGGLQLHFARRTWTEKHDA